MMTQANRPCEEGGRKHGWLCAAVFLTFLTLYAVTAQRGVSWQDSGIFQHRVLTGTFTPLGGGGLAVVHPWYLTFARMFCLFFPAPLRLYAVNLFSGVGLAVAVSLLAMLVCRLTRQRAAAVVAAVTLGLAQMAWWLATIAEVYTWSLAFLFAELLCLLQVCEVVRLGRWTAWWCALLAVNGVHASLHNVALLNLPVYAVLWVFQIRQRPWRARRLIGFACGCALSWTVGAAELISIFIKDLQESQSILASMSSLLVGSTYGGAVLGNTPGNVRLALQNLALSGCSFLTPCWLLALGAVRARARDPRRVFTWATLALTLIHAFFWVRYFVPDQATFMLPTLGLCSVWVGIGSESFLERGGRRCRLMTLLVAGLACQILLPPALAQVARRYVSRSRQLPFRDEARYWLVPWKHDETSAQQFSEAVDATLGEGDVLVGDLTAVNPLQAARAAGICHGNWRLISEWSGETESDAVRIAWDVLQAGKRVFVVSPVRGYTPEALLKSCDFEKDGVLWRVKERK